MLLVQLIALPIDCDRPRGIIDFVQKQPALHMIVRIPLDDLALQFEHDNRNRPLRRLERRIIRILLRREQRQRPQPDCIALFQHIRIIVAQIVPDDIRDAGLTAASRPHPEDIVVAPLDIERRAFHDLLENRIRPRTAVKEIPDNVHVIHSQPLHQHCHRLDELSTAVNLHDHIQQPLVIDELRLICLRPRIHELDDHRREPIRDEALHLRQRIFIGHELGQLDKPRQILPVPFRCIPAFDAHALDLFLRIVDQRAELGLLLVRQPRPENIVHFLLDDAGAVVQYMEERLILAMQVAHEMLDALWQAKLRLQMHQPLINGFFRRIFFRQEPQILHFLRLLPFISSLHTLTAPFSKQE